MSSVPDKCFIIWSKSSGRYKTLSSILARDGWQIFTLNRISLLDQFASDHKKLMCLAILGPVGELKPEDVDSIRRFVTCGHKTIIAHTATDKEAPPPSNINELTELFGVSFNEDCVIRPNPFKLFHPSEAMLEDFVANRGLTDSLKKFTDHKSDEFEPIAGLVDILDLDSGGPRIIYPQGCTLKVSSKEATVMMTSSKWALPSCQPICAFYRSEDNRARIIMLGSFKLLTDDYIDKENNTPLVSSFLEFLSKDDFHINVSDARTLEVPESNLTADMDLLVNMPIPVFKELEALPEDKLSLIDKRLFNVDNSKLPQVLRAYADLNVDNRALTLMRPSFSWRADDSAPVTRDQLKFMFRRDNGEIELI